MILLFLNIENIFVIMTNVIYLILFDMKGLPPDVRVIAWGLSLERPTMIKYRIENIRDLFGHKADLLSQRNAPMARF